MMVEEYGIPTWGSYAVFAVATIMVGALLGLVLVCIIDCIYPQRSPRPSPLTPLDGEDEVNFLLFIKDTLVALEV